MRSMMRTENSAATILIVWAFVTLVAAWAGPFGTYSSQPFLSRLGYWGFLIGTSVPIGRAAQLFWRQTLDSKPQWVQDLLAVLTMMLVFGPLLVAFNSWMTGPLNHSGMDWRLSLSAIFLIGVSTLGVERLVRATISPVVSQGPSKRRDRLLDRIDVADDVRLAHVSSDNHHVWIATNDGAEHRILMRFRDAVTEIDVENGVCVHRSHWVSLRQIQSIELRDGKEVVRMKRGTLIPIGAKYRPHLVETGAIAA